MIARAASGAAASQGRAAAGATQWPGPGSGREWRPVSGSFPAGRAGRAALPGLSNPGQATRMS